MRPPPKQSQAPSLAPSEFGKRPTTGTFLPRKVHQVLGLVLAFLLMTAPGRVGNTDVAITMDLSRSLLHGTVTLDPQCSECAIGVGGIRTSQYGIGHSAYLIPWILIGRGLAVLAPGLGIVRWEEFAVGFSNIPIIVLLLVLLARRWLALGASESRTAFGILLFTGCTLLGPYARMPFSDALLALGSFAAWYCWQLNQRMSAIAAGAWLGFALLSRRQADAVIPVLLLIMVLQAARQHRFRHLAMALLAMLPFGAIRLAYNFARFGSPWLEVHPRLSAARVVERSLEAGFSRLDTVLFSPAEGFLWYGLIPILVAVAGIRGLRQRCGWDALTLVLVTGAGIGFLGVLRFGPGVTFGSRYLLYVVPFLALAWPFLPSPSSGHARAVAGVAMIASAAIMAGGFALDPVPIAIRHSTLEGPCAQARATLGEWRRVLSLGNSTESRSLTSRSDWSHPAFGRPDFWWCHALAQGRHATETSSPEASPGGTTIP